MPQKDKYRIYAEMLQLHPSRRETSSSIILKLQPCERRTAKEMSTIAPQGSSGRTFFSKFTSPEQS
jgi:hypothetical protein